MSTTDADEAQAVADLGQARQMAYDILDTPDVETIEAKLRVLQDLLDARKAR